MTINIGNGNKIINSIVKENEMKTTYLYENGKKVVFNDQHILDYVNGANKMKTITKILLVTCLLTINVFTILWGVSSIKSDARSLCESTGQQREIDRYEHRDFINFSEWQAVKDMCAVTCPGDCEAQIERFERWALTKDKQELKSMLECMDNIPACLPEKQGILNVLGAYNE